MKHIKTPSTVVRKATNERLLYHIRAADDDFVCLDVISRQAALEIVRAVNAHDPLLEALRPFAALPSDEPLRDDEHISIVVTVADIRRAREALERAEDGENKQ